MTFRGAATFITYGLLSVAVIAGALAFAVETSKLDAIAAANSDMELAADNVRAFVRRDVLLSGFMTSMWDTLPPQDIVGDTLILRFSTIDSLRYYVGDETLWRSETFIAKNVKRFEVWPDDGYIMVRLTLEVPMIHWRVNGGKPYARAFEWKIVPRDDSTKTERWE